MWYPRYRERGNHLEARIDDPFLYFERQLTVADGVRCLYRGHQDGGGNRSFNGIPSGRCSLLPVLVERWYFPG